MTSNADRADRWMDVALGRTELGNFAALGNVYAEGDTVFSYGSHFPMATVMRERPNDRGGWRHSSSPTTGEPRWVLVNGDSYSPTTSQHQGAIRSVVAGSGLPSIIVPFTALDAAGIERTSIEILEVRADRTETTRHTAAEVSGDVVETYVGSNKVAIIREDGSQALDWQGQPAFRTEPTYERDPNRRYVTKNSRTVAEWDEIAEVWRWETTRHFLGDSIFSARANGRRCRFLSSFDYQEARALYFLCALPRSSKARTVEQGLHDLRPKSVLAADEAGLAVERQGDMFAIPTELTTREVKKLTPYGKGRIVKRPRGGVLGTRHSASQIVFATEGRVYARGTLYHEPEGWRGADHARRRMGDGKTWYLLTRNTVPRQQTRERSTV